jgi:hypothetical protein
VTAVNYRMVLDEEGRRLAAAARSTAKHQLPVWSNGVAARVAQLVQHPGFRELSVYENRWAVALDLGGHLRWFFADDIDDVTQGAVLGARFQRAKDRRELERRAAQMAHVAIPART